MAIARHEESSARLTPRDLYRLRHSYLMAQRAAMRAQYAQLQFRELSLELERRYGLLDCEALLDIQTGAITQASINGATEEVNSGPADDADTGTP